MATISRNTTWALDLARYQAKAEPFFTAWTACVAHQAGELKRKSAASYRDQIVDVAKEAIASLPQGDLSSRGLYLFWAETPSPPAIIYVGLVKGQKGANRIYDYLGKQLSILDPVLLHEHDEKAAKDLILRRLMAVLPNPEAINRSYIREHMKSRKLSRARWWSFFPAEASDTELELAESLLIASAKQLGPEHIVNRHKLGGAKRREWPENTRDLARCAIHHWIAAGFPEDVGRAWIVASDKAMPGHKVTRPAA